jgi:hypothetical protein
MLNRSGGRHWEDGLCVRSCGFDRRSVRDGQHDAFLTCKNFRPRPMAPPIRRPGVRRASRLQRDAGAERRSAAAPVGAGISAVD